MSDPSQERAPGSASSDAPDRPRGRMIAPVDGRHVYEPITRVLGGAVAPLAPTVPGTADRPLRVAMILPHFEFGSGGHQVLFELGCGLERLGHAVSYWLHDPFSFRRDKSCGSLRQSIVNQYAPIGGPVHDGFEHWTGADVAMATGWQTVYPVMGLEGCRSRVYVVNDHEPEFYPTSLEAYFAAQTYTLGLPCIVGGGPWMRQLLEERYGASVAATFPYPVADAFRQRPVARREDTIVVYGRNTTPRRAVGLALIALEELTLRRPDLRIVLFGDPDVPDTTFPYEHLGPIAPERLSWVYSEATVGIALSMTHGSLVPHDMMACGLPVVSLAGYGTGTEHADTGLVELVPFDPYRMADALEALLDDPRLRAERSRAGQAYVTAPTWSSAAAQVERGLRDVLRAREAATGSGEGAEGSAR